MVTSRVQGAVVELHHCRNNWEKCSGRLWLRGRASTLLLEGHWFDSPDLHVKVSLGKILNPKLLLMCWSAACMAATAINVCMYLWIAVSRFGQKHLLNALKCKCTYECFKAPDYRILALADPHGSSCSLPPLAIHWNPLLQDKSTVNWNQSTNLCDI